IYTYESYIIERVPFSKMYIVSSERVLDTQLIDIMKSKAKNITILSSRSFNETVAKQHDIVLINFEWINSQTKQTIKCIEDFTLNGTVPIIFYGKKVYSLYETFNKTRIINTFSVFPGKVFQNGTVKIIIPKDVIAIGISVVPLKNHTRVPVMQLFLVGELIPREIVSHVLEWYPLLKEYKEKSQLSINRYNNIVASTEEKKSITTLTITPENWDEECGYLGWYIADIKVSSTKIAEMQILAKYWHANSPSHPGSWHYFLIHVQHKIVPSYSWVAPYESITQVDGDTDNKPGQILWDYEPVNWGGPQGTISFSISVGEGGIQASVSYTFSKNTLSWGDQSDPARGLHKTYHSYYTWNYYPFGYTSTVEPSTIYLKDAAKDGGELPLQVTHYAWSKVAYCVGWLIYYTSNSYTFDAAVYPPSEFPGGSY
ncbi:MAG: hypothetical protein J7L07_00230, partial [Candidatus Odinarchaeota archaeon]|nr:hypothetical protein [Candidatus Odinarchaeota archaeon]